MLYQQVQTNFAHSAKLVFPCFCLEYLLQEQAYNIRIRCGSFPQNISETGETVDKKTVKTVIITAFLAAAAVAAAVKPEVFMGIISRTADLLTPVFIGMAIAFVMNMPFCSIKKFFKKRFKRIGERTANIISVGTAYILLLAILTGIVWIIIPQLGASVRLFLDNADRYYSNFLKYCEILERRDSFGFFAALKNAVEGLSEKIPAMLEATYSKTTDVIGGAADLLIGFVLSIYILLSKDSIKCAVSAAAKCFAGERYEKIRKGYRLVFSTFSRFVVGQITEAVVLGVLCFAGMKLFGFEYALLISTIIGVTALIPLVGAIIGTVPSALLLFLIRPIDAVWFIVFIIVLQQLENNLIYPRVVGKSLGIPPLLVFLAILLGAGLGGAVGILLGVPLMSVVYVLLREKICGTSAGAINSETAAR